MVTTRIFRCVGSRAFLGVLADFSLNLALLFLLSAAQHATRQQQEIAMLRVELARSSARHQAAATEPAATVSVSRSGEIAIDDRLLGSLARDNEGLLAALRNALAGLPEGHVRLRIDHTEPMQTYATLYPALCARALTLQVERQ